MRKQAASITVDARMIRSSGIGTYLRCLLPTLIAKNRDIRFRLLGGADLIDFEWAGGAGVEQVSLDAPIYGVREQVSLAREARRDGEPFWSPHYNIPLLRRGRLLVTLHDLAHLALPELVRGVHRRAYARVMFGAVKRATVRIFDSRFTADQYARLVAPVGERDEVIHPGVDESWFSIERGTRPHPRPYLLYVGNVKPHKNLGALVEMIAEMRDEIRHDLVIVGRREGFIHGDAGVLERAAALGDRVQFTGWIDDERLKRYFVHAEALLFPSFYEGFGLPPLEAMASGCPTIVSRAASLPEVCGDAALYCDPASPLSIAGQLRTLLGDSALRADLVARGVERAKSFTWERCGRDTSQVIRSIIDG